MILNKEPFIVLADSCLPAELLSQMLAQKQFEESLGWDVATANRTKVEHRTSSTYFDLENKFKPAIEHFIKLLAQDYGHHYDLGDIETWQLAKYEVGQQYKPHFDYFNFPGYPQQNPDRIATVILYLNDDFADGGTAFPELELIVKPKAGYFLYFRYPPGESAKLTLHAGLPVSAGEKRIATLWIRAKAD
jgi:prolyl 4-hydroxylase